MVEFYWLKLPLLQTSVVEKKSLFNHLLIFSVNVLLMHITAAFSLKL